MDLPKKVLIIRNDKLGDFMLAYPAFNVVKKLFPCARIYALVPEYTKTTAEMCQWIDEIIIDDATEGFSSLVKTTSKLKAYKFDAALCLHSSPRIAISLFLAGIRHRFAPASRLEQLFYNHRLSQRRSRSDKPEYEYNIDLANFMGEYFSILPATPDEPPYLTLLPADISKFKQVLFDRYRVDFEKNIIVVHPGTGGSARNLSVIQFAEIINHLSDNKSLFFIISAGPGEENLAQELSALIKSTNYAIYLSTSGLKDFTKLVSLAALFISGSTGVLHIAGALNVPTVAFYPYKKSATSLRWQTLNTPSRRLAFSESSDSENADFEIDISSIISSIRDKYTL